MINKIQLRVILNKSMCPSHMYPHARALTHTRVRVRSIDITHIEVTVIVVTSIAYSLPMRVLDIFNELKQYIRSSTFVKK